MTCVPRRSRPETGAAPRSGTTVRATAAATLIQHTQALDRSARGQPERRQPDRRPRSPAHDLDGDSEMHDARGPKQRRSGKPPTTGGATTALAWSRHRQRRAAGNSNAPIHGGETPEAEGAQRGAEAVRTGETLQVVAEDPLGVDGVTDPDFDSFTSALSSRAARSRSIA